MSDLTRSDEEIRAIANDVVGLKVDRVVAVTSGGNNRIHRLDCGAESFALKFYPPQADDPRDRLGAEFAALDFLSRGGISTVPSPLGRDDSQHCALYEWIDGTPVSDWSSGDVDALADFLTAIQSLRDAEGAGDIRPASASCLSPLAVLEQFADRFMRFLEVAQDFPELDRFLSEELAPLSDGVIPIVLDRLVSWGIEPGQEIEASARAFSPSDFGFHNALRRPDGSLVFLDFEYFGWDDPCKMIADVRLHPGMELTSAMQMRFMDRIGPFFAARDPMFNERFRFILPICALIWCLILLNEYLPERWARRNLADRVGDPQEVRARQLGRSRRMLEWINGTFARDVGF